MITLKYDKDEKGGDTYTYTNKEDQLKIKYTERSYKDVQSSVIKLMPQYWVGPWICIVLSIGFCNNQPDRGYVEIGKYNHHEDQGGIYWRPSKKREWIFDEVDHRAHKCGLKSNIISIKDSECREARFEYNKEKGDFYSTDDKSVRLQEPGAYFKSDQLPQDIAYMCKKLRVAKQENQTEILLDATTEAMLKKWQEVLIRVNKEYMNFNSIEQGKGKAIVLGKNEEEGPSLD